MVTTSAMPGKKLIQYLPESRYSKPLAISRPSEGSVIGSPMPRNDKVASSAMALATCRTDADCDDGDACTADTCAGCACMHQTGCDDGDACTIDACDPTAGCTATPIAGYPGVACVCGRDLAGTCGGTAPPRAVRRLFAHACSLVSRAAGKTNPARARALVRRALAAFRRARARASTSVRRGTLAPACGDTVRSVIDDALKRFRPETSSRVGIGG